MDESTCLIDGFGPVPVVRPDTVSALGDVIRQASADSTAVYPVGGKTMLHLGAPPTRQGRAVDLRGLTQVIDFPARDMTITVQAGITMGHLQEILAREKLRLPIDVPHAGQATLGGTLAANVSGSRRYGFGTLRDYVIGISAVNDAGHEFKAGGRVVKNVAGYDLCKLLVGSLGTLGIITQATLKLRPGAEEQALVTLGCTDSALETVLDQLHSSRTRPVCLDVANRAAVGEIFGQAYMPIPAADWVAVIGFEGNGAAVNWQVQQLVREVGTAGALEARVGVSARPLWQALAEWDAWPSAQVTLRANVLPSRLGGFCRSVSQVGEKTWLRAHAGNGIVTGHLAGALAREQAIATLGRWRELAAPGVGSVIVTRCPPAWKDERLSVWGPAPKAAWLMREVKGKFDPRRLFNPGRFVDGL
jgi:glycolate oxidase FAD binding subunit